MNVALKTKCVGKFYSSIRELFMTETKNIAENHVNGDNFGITWSSFTASTILAHKYQQLSISFWIEAMQMLSNQFILL